MSCIPPPVGGAPIVWHMDVGDKLNLQNLKYGANQQVYVTCGPQVADTCGCQTVQTMIQDGKVTAKGTLASGARLAMEHSSDTNTVYKKIELVCKPNC